MSQENLDLVVTGMRAALARPKPDFATMNRAFAPDHVYLPLAAGSLQEVGHGAKGFLEWRADTEAVFNAEHEVKGAVDVGPDKVLAVVSTHFRGAASGVAAEQRSWVVLTVRERKITRTESFSTAREALEAAGLSE